MYRSGTLALIVAVTEHIDSNCFAARDLIQVDRLGMNGQMPFPHPEPNRGGASTGGTTAPSPASSAPRAPFHQPPLLSSTRCYGFPESNRGLTRVGDDPPMSVHGGQRPAAEARSRRRIQRTTVDLRPRRPNGNQPEARAVRTGWFWGDTSDGGEAVDLRRRWLVF
jgi:hypothetical protein